MGRVASKLVYHLLAPPNTEHKVLKVVPWLQEREAVPCCEQVLLHGGRLLQDGSTLAAQQVFQEATLDLVLRLRY